MKYSLFRKFSFAIITVALVTAAPSMSYGQWILGLKAGLNYCKIDGKDIYGGMNYKPCVEAGFVISKKLKVDFALESGLFFSQTGVNQKFISITRTSYDSVGHRMSDDSTFRVSNSLSLNYVKLPLMLRKSFSIKGKNIYPFRRKISLTDIDIMVGPYVAYMISATETFDTKVSVQKTKDGVPNGTPNAERGLNDQYHLSFNIGRDTLNQIISTDLGMIAVSTDLYPYLPKRATIQKGLNRLDVGLTAALGLSFELSPDMKLNIGGNYSMGFLSIDKEYYSDLTYTVSPGGNINYKGTGQLISISKKVKRKMDLKNTGFGFYVGVVKYLK